jgi:hypothetical protein
MYVIWQPFLEALRLWASPPTPLYLGLYYSINLSICDEKLVSSIKQSTQQKEGGEQKEEQRKKKNNV